MKQHQLCDLLRLQTKIKEKNQQTVCYVVNFSLRNSVSYSPSAVFCPRREK